MRKYLKESLHWLHLALFKPVSMEYDIPGSGIKQVIWIYVKVFPVQTAVILSLIALTGSLCELGGYGFNWSQAVEGLVLGELIGAAAMFLGGLGILLSDDRRVALAGGLGLGLEIGVLGGLCIGLVAGLVGGLRGMPMSGPLGEFVGSLSSDVLGGLIVGLVFGQVARLWIRLGSTLGLLLGIGFGIALAAGATNKGLGAALLAGTTYEAVFLFVYLRPFYLVPHVVQYWRSKKAADPFLFFRNSPVYWDESIAMPLPFLRDWLLNLATVDRERGMNEIAHMLRLPHRRRAAQRALITLVVIELQQEADRLEKMVSAPQLLAALPSDTKYLPKGLDDVARNIVQVADLASDYLTRFTQVGQMDVLRELRAAVKSLYESLFFVMTIAPVGPAFEIRNWQWLDIVEAEEARCRKRMTFEPVPNPFVVGNPLMVRDENLFKGRKDIIVAIEENIINPAQGPALLLYGRRRIGKTSTLLNLPRLLGSKFVPVFIDCQDAKWREGDEAFCYHLAASIHDALNQGASMEPAPRPQLERFERYAFTRLGEYLDQIEESSRSAHKKILLTFDEYEKLEEGISASKVTTEVLNQLRTIVQHRERIVVLFSGGHRFEEMRTINWSDYLINVKTLELSFLAATDARELITEPVPLLQYESGVIEQIVELTHRQPYLLQAVASDLVNYLNTEKRMLATSCDMDVAVEKVLVTADSYFFYTWTGDCSEAEREVLRMIAVGDANNRTLTEHQASLQSLCHKEILERYAGGYRFSIELFRRWVLKNQTAHPFTPGDLPEPAELEYAAS